MKLYYVPQTRSVRVRWLLEEMGIPYELQRIDIASDENDKPAYRAVHPLGHVPALEHEGITIYESAAIVAWLAEKFPEKRMAPPSGGSKERAEYLKWMFFGMATFEPVLADIAAHTRFLPEEKRIPALVQQRLERFKEVAAVIQSHMASRPFILGSDFSAADVVVGGIVNWARGNKLLEDFPTLKEYSKRLTDRPAFKRAIAD